MSAISMGDMAQSFLLRRQNVGLKFEIQRLSTEVTTGQVTDTAARVVGDLVPISGLDASLTRLKAYDAVIAEAGLFANTMQVALDHMDQAAGSLSSALLTASSGASAGRVDAAGRDARRTLENLLSAMNTRVGNRSIFAGQQTGNAAVIDTETLLTALEAAVVSAGAVSGADVETAVVAWFDDPAGYEATAYQGGPALASLTVAVGEEVSLDITANDTALRDTLKGVAMAALLDRGVLSGQPVGRQDLASRAGVRLLENKTDRADLAARLGQSEAQIEDAKARNSSEASALQIARNDIVAADPYETASKLEQAQTQLEKIYALTARMTRLSLLDYLK